jgi:hypothetical protein
MVVNNIILVKKKYDGQYCVILTIYLKYMIILYVRIEF